MIPRVSSQFKRAEAFIPPAHFAHDPVANDYDVFFSVLNFEVVPERDESKPWPGNPPHPERAYVKAQLVMIREKIEYHTELRRFLVRHPDLVLRLGFRPAVDPNSPSPGPRMKARQQTLRKWYVSSFFLRRCKIEHLIRL